MILRLEGWTTTAILAVLLASGGALRAAPAGANSNGITGASGKQGITCTSCHSGGLPPEVRFIGPGTVAPGALATFRFEVQSIAPNQRRAGFNVASSEGRLDVVPDQGARRTQNNELTHTDPKQNVDMLAGWDFTWTAPDTPGVYTLFGAGNSVNFNGQSSGDRSATTTLEVAVAVDTPTPTATPQPPTPTITPTRSPGALRRRLQRQRRRRGQRARHQRQHRHRQAGDRRLCGHRPQRQRRGGDQRADRRRQRRARPLRLKQRGRTGRPPWPAAG